MPQEKYLKAEKINLEEVKEIFEKKGFEVIFLEQLWRHVHGKLRKNNKYFFLKLASTIEIGSKTENEISWNENVAPLLKNLSSIKIPKIYETGKLKDRFYYLSEFCEGDLLATKFPPNLKNLKNWLDKIVELNITLLSYQKIKFKKDNNLSEKEISDNYVNNIKQKYEDVKEYKLNEIFIEVEKLRNSFSPKINHGDFVPWHFIEGENAITLIDAEHASSYLPKYYDVCYFYERLYARGESPELAKEYLRKIKESLSETEKQNFDKELKPVLASRIIIGIRDLVILDNITDIGLYNKLKEDFLKDNLY